MSEKLVKYVGGSQTGVELDIPFKDGDVFHVHVPHGGTLPAEVHGRKIPAEYRKSLLEQPDNWSDTAKAEKEGDK